MKKIMVFILSLFFIYIPSVSALDFEPTGKNIILYNLNDESILYERDADTKTPIASLTKMMTAIVAIENIENLEEKVAITYNDFLNTYGYSKAGFRVGEEVTYLDLLYGILLPSGADAVNAIVNNTLGEEKFIESMNELAKSLGMDDTSFSNAIGRDDELNYSTASDVAKLLKFAIKNNTFKTIFTSKEYITTNGLKLNSTLNAYQSFLKIDEIKGAKSGFTSGAGRCLASITTLNDVDYLLVIINATPLRYYSAVEESIKVYEYYDQNYSYQTILDDTKFSKTIPIKWSSEKEYEIIVNEDVKKYLKNGEAENLRYEYSGAEEIKLFTAKGSKLGNLKVYNGEELLYETDVLLNKDIKYISFGLYIILGILVLLIILGIIIIKKMQKRRDRKFKAVYDM